MSVLLSLKTFLNIRLVPHGLTRLCREAAEFFNPRSIQMTAMFFTIICCLGKLVSALHKTLNILLHVTKYEKSINHFGPASLTVDCEAEKQ